MTDIQSLMAQKATLDAQIAAARPAAIAQVREMMHTLNVSPADLRTVLVAKRAVKFRDVDGNTWTGIGKRPKWLNARITAGAVLDEFKA